MKVIIFAECIKIMPETVMEVRAIKQKLGMSLTEETVMLVTLHPREIQVLLPREMELKDVSDRT